MEQIIVYAPSIENNSMNMTEQRIFKLLYKYLKNTNKNIPKTVTHPWHLSPSHSLISTSKLHLVRNDFNSEQKLISKVLFFKCIQLITVRNKRQFEPFSWREYKDVWRAAPTLGTGETHKAERKMFGFLIIWGRQTAGGNREVYE